MKNKLKGLLLLLLILGVSFTMPGFMDNTTRAADEAEWSEEGGSTFHGFTIVEIVPYKGMGEIGYLIGGQEPVDGSLINWDNATGAFGFLGDAVKVYPNYTESALPVSGQAANGWRAAYTYVSQNGYFELQGSSGPNLYSINENQTVYERVAAGTGAYKASLPANYSLGNLYDTYNTVNNRKNVKAYFVYGQPTGVSLFSTSNRYRAYSVTRSNTNSGDYDYDVAGKVFVYNAAGKGMYDVLFVADGAGSYYMLNQYEIVEDNSGDYSCDTVTYTQLSGNTGGNYNRVTGVPTFTYQQYWGGYYRWVQDNGALTKPTNYYREGNRIWVKGFKVQQGYQYCYMGQIVNNEWFKTMTLGIPAEQVREYPVRVITITPEELNNTANQHYIDEANLFYINANYDHNVNYISNYENYSTAGRALPANQKYAGDSNKRYNDLNFAKHDISWTVTDKLFRKIAGIGCNKASLIIDAKFYMDAISNNHSAYKPYYKNNVNLGVNYNNNGATSLNMAKLYIMIYQRNMIDFYNSFINPATSIAQNRITAYEVSTNINPTGSTGSFIRPDSNNSATSNASIYWNGNTFLPFGLNADGVMTTYPNAQALYAAGIYNIDMTLQTTDITNNVLTLNGQDIFTSKFTQGVTVPNRNAGDVLTPEDITNQLGANNPSGTTDSTISIGDFANIITNNGSGYGNTGGVSYPGGSNVEGPPEVRPPEDPAEIPEDGTDGSNLRSYKRVLNIQPTAFFTNSENEIRAMLSNYDVQIISMTSMQFNGCVEDLNSRYDMIYLGSGVYNNISYNRFNTFSESGVTRTDFNDTSLNRFIYTVAGDLKSFTDSQTYRYVSNDITAQKKTELEAFRAAGYPIVVDSNLYELSTTNNARVNSNTNIYKFINTSKSSSNLFNYSNYTNGLTRSVFLTKLKYCFNTIRPIVKLETPILPDTSDVNYAYVDPVTRYLTIRFKLLPKNSIPSIYTYNAYLYLDKNGDGIFEASEKLDTRSRDGSQWTDMRENSSKTYMYEYDMSALNGVYQWKLIVERAGNTNIRATITGYAANSKPEDLYILQITDNSSAYSLDEMILNSTKLISRYAGAGKLTDYKLHFDTLTVSEYEQLFASPNVAYRSSNPAATGKLSKYHILIMDNPTDPIHNDNGAVQNIKDEINRNLGVIYTKGAIGYQKQSNYYEAAKNSFIYYDSVSNSYQNTYHYINRNSLDGSNP